jgi:seryl-tRNA(Sec) selenium transferase
MGGGKMKRLTPEEKYIYSLRKQREALNAFSGDEELNSEMLLAYYKQNGRDMPDDIYRACAFFINREYQRKSGSLYLLYQTLEKLQKEFTGITKENAIDVLCYRYQVYAAMLREGGY